MKESAKEKQLKKFRLEYLNEPGNWIRELVYFYAEPKNGFFVEADELISYTKSKIY